MAWANLTCWAKPVRKVESAPLGHYPKAEAGVVLLVRRSVNHCRNEHASESHLCMTPIHGHRTVRRLRLAHWIIAKIWNIMYTGTRQKREKKPLNSYPT